MRSLPQKFRVQVIIEPDADGFHAYCPTLKGLHVGGDTREEALKNAKDAVIVYLRAFIKHNHSIPIGSIEVPSNNTHEIEADTKELALTKS